MTGKNALSCRPKRTRKAYPAQSVFAWGRLDAFCKMHRRRGMFSFATKREPEKCQRFRRAGPTRKGLLAPFRPQRGSRTGKNLAASLNDFFSVLHLYPLSRYGGSSPKGSGGGETGHFAVLPETFPPCQGLSPWESWICEAKTERARTLPPRRRFHRKQALQMPFAVTTPPVKMGFRKVRRLS